MMSLVAGMLITITLAWASAAAAPTPRIPIGVPLAPQSVWPTDPPEWWRHGPLSVLVHENVWMRMELSAQSVDSATYVVYAYSFGFPLRSHRSELWVSNDTSTAPARTREQPRGIRTGGRHANGDPRLLPTRFLMVGWIIDSACFGAIVLASWGLPGSLRRRARFRRGACVNCGYELGAGVNVCPECGHSRATG